MHSRVAGSLTSVVFAYSLWKKDKIQSHVAGRFTSVVFVTRCGKKPRLMMNPRVAGRFTVPAFAAYSMSKKACIAFSDALRLEMKKFDVAVITIEPGLYRYKPLLLMLVPLVVVVVGGGGGSVVLLPSLL